MSQEQEQVFLEETEQSPTETWDYEKMNQLLGLTGDEEQETEVEEFEEEDFIEVEEQPKKKGIAKNPWVKLALIAACTASGFLAVAFLFASAPLGGGGTGAESVATEEKKEEIEQISNELEVLKAELALARQDQQMREMAARMDSQEPLDSQVPSVVIAAEEEEIIPEPVAVPPEPEIRVASPPPPRQVSRQVSVEPVGSPPPPPVKSATTKPTSPLVKPEDSLATWHELASLGSYGGAVVSQQPVAIAPAVDVAMVEGTTLVLGADEQRLLGGVSEVGGNTLRSGTRIPGEIVNSVIAAGQDSAYIAVITSQPVIIEGQQVLPAGTEVLFGFSSIHSSGMVLASAIALVVEGREIEVPEGVLQLRAPEGKPLMAQKQNTTGGEIARRQATGFVIGALGKVGEISNRPQSVSSSGSFGNFSNTTTYNSPNYVGAVLEGGLSPLSRQWEQQNQQAIRELQQRGDLWVIPLGQPIEIVVNRSFSF
jgi:hypothetical protein